MTAVVRLADLTAAQARLVAALLEANKKAAPAIVSPGTAAPEVRRGSVDRPAA